MAVRWIWGVGVVGTGPYEFSPSIETGRLAQRGSSKPDAKGGRMRRTGLPTTHSGNLGTGGSPPTRDRARMDASSLSRMCDRGWTDASEQSRRAGTVQTHTSGHSRGVGIGGPDASERSERVGTGRADASGQSGRVYMGGTGTSGSSLPEGRGQTKPSDLPRRTRATEIFLPSSSRNANFRELAESGVRDVSERAPQTDISNQPPYA